MIKNIRQTLLLFLALTLLTGVVYPLGITLVAQLCFPFQANGSLVTLDKELTETVRDEDSQDNRYWWQREGETEGLERAKRGIGSELIGQTFSSPGYFWSRPSAAGYNGGASAGSNYGPTNPAQLDAVRGRIEALRQAGHDPQSPVPIDLVTASASGLDPDISPAAADYQVQRVAQARGISEYEIGRIVAEHTEHRTFGLLGEPRVNVLRLNLALDRLR